MKTQYSDINTQALDALIQRVSEAKEHNLALTPEDCQLLIDALLTLASMQENLASNSITIHKLKKLVGMVKSSEKLRSSLAQSNAKKSKKKKKGNKSDSPVATIKPVVVHHPLADMAKGDDCPECDRGKLYKYEPATLLRIIGQSPFQSEQHVMERLRCNTCGAYFTAPLPEEVLNDGGANQKYGHSARSIMGIAKFGMGSPYYRQGAMQNLLGVPITASTIFDQNEHLSNALHPVLKHLVLLAANATHYYLDDTTNRILDAKPIIKKQRNSHKSKERKGVYTSGLIATLDTGQKVTLFETNIGYAGEFIDQILQTRDPAKPPPILMCDGLTSNKPSKTPCIMALCNSHGRRQFYDVMSHFPEEVDYLLDRYGTIWHNDDVTKEKNLSDQGRLMYHKKHSLPVMEELLGWGQSMLQSQGSTQAKVEENSGLGKAIRYFIKHYEGLVRFCYVAGAQIDNNTMEAALKLAVLNRKNASFYKTQAGASIGDVIMSLIATCIQSGVNAFDYFNALQRDNQKVIDNPGEYLPWNYQKNNT
ncbi:MAG: transposase [Osedax symbiont Rs1]|nr:MAG: transposase [Osedax symbiont Rs1]